MDEFNFLPFTDEFYDETNYKNAINRDTRAIQKTQNISVPESENEWEQEYHLIYNSYILEAGV